MEFRVGTSGWNYPTGRGTWNGIFYPLPEDRERGFDELRFYAERFNTVEVNSTFYGQPRANVTLGWVRRTPDGFDFSIKLFQKFTHPGMAVDPGPVTQDDVDQFKGGIEPVAAAGRLGAVLAQFPPSFHRSPEAEAYLDWLLRTFASYSIAVELRHRSWSDDAAATRALLDAHDAAWVQIDEPKFDSSIRQELRPNGREVFYARLHGRNAAQWWDHEEAEDRYNYLYSPAELAPIAQKARDARALVKKVYLYLNNHFSAQSVANATTLRKMLDEPVTARMPAELVERYPELEGVPTLPRARLL
ncbi:MAG: hypothetical protein A3J29_23900 [Acidobacteria bacterium RIFCSPLOWO2_12_FULL_67_14b]|nr:MAG: hypothetical protein A3J29_23900 [Acidobacteria bacterium RIFCSPLOWO2_12_FULL_67_14b]